MMRLPGWLWAGIGILGAIAFAAIAKGIRPGEPVNALWLVVAAACFYVLAYRFYGAFLAARVMTLDDQRVTPAWRLRDNKNFQPTHRWILFGHHFAAIAGAGPLLGPVLAAQFGYLPGLLWLLVGAVVAGGVHDFVILVSSIRRNGRSFPQIARDEVSRITGIAASIAVLFIVIVAMAGLGLAVVNALYHNPWGAFTIALTIPIALVMGSYLHILRPGRVAEVTWFGVVALLAAVAFGRLVPGSAIEHWFSLDRPTLTVLLAGYGFAASVLPVWVLLVPRDYLSTFMKISVVILLAIGVVVIAPDLHLPAFTQFVHGGGPVIPGPWFPFVFITIACGALSGFHSLIASGTTPKMVERESHTRMIGYGAMLLEGFVGVMAVIAAALLVPGDYFSINTALTPAALTGMGYPPARIGELSTLVGVDVSGRPGGAVSLAVGMASIFSSLPGMKSLMAFWYQFALLFEALFILTTLDAGTRVARYLVQEAAGGLIRPRRIGGRVGDIGWWPGTVAASLGVVTAWGYFIYTGTIATIWPIFGVANQLLGVLALCVGTTVLIKMGKARYLWVTLIPMAFMATTNLTASSQLLEKFLGDAQAKALTGKAAEAFTLRLDAVIVASVAALALIILVDSAVGWYRYLILKHPYRSSEFVETRPGISLPPTPPC